MALLPIHMNYQYEAIEKMVNNLENLKEVGQTMRRWSKPDEDHEGVRWEKLKTDKANRRTWMLLC